MNPLVLFVDNDIANLVVFESSLDGVLPYRTATHSSEALQILGSEEIGVFLLGQPDASRPDILDTVRRDHPDTIRMVLTEGETEESVAAALEAGRADCCLPRPRDAQELRFTLESALERYRMARRLRELESKLLSAERIYSLGVAAAELAHEIRNPLGSLASNLRVATESLAGLQVGLESSQAGPRLAGILEALEDCAAATETLEEITRSMEIASRGSAGPGPLDMQEVVRIALRSIELNAKRRGVVDVETSPVPAVRGSRTRIGQVVTNLVLNGIQASASLGPRPGRVSVRLWHEGGEVFLEVEDSGPGIDPAIRDRIFEPFFTTKEEGGTGLGLAISRRIVEEHGGRIQVASGRQGGSRFLVALPASPSG